MNIRYVAPQYSLDAFNCPHCGAYSSQIWATSALLRHLHSIGIKDIAISVCKLCGESAVWVEDLNSLDIDHKQLAGASPSTPDFDAGAGAGQIYSSSIPVFK